MLYSRREWLVTSSFLTTSAFVNWRNKGIYQYLMAKVTATKTVLPEGKYLPFDWSFGEIGVNTEGVHLSWSQTNISKKSGIRLRITSATDVREVVVLEVKTATSGKKIGDLDIRFAHLLQPFEIEIPAESIKIVLAEGVQLTMKQGTKPFWFFSEKQKSKKLTRTSWRPGIAQRIERCTGFWKTPRG